MQGKRGPKPYGHGAQIQVRLQPPELEALDAWIERQPEPMSRPEAIRRLIAASLKGRC